MAPSLHHSIEEDVRDLTHPLGAAFVVADDGVTASSDGGGDYGCVCQSQAAMCPNLGSGAGDSPIHFDDMDLRCPQNDPDLLDLPLPLFPNWLYE